MRPLYMSLVLATLLCCFGYWLLCRHRAKRDNSAMPSNTRVLSIMACSVIMGWLCTMFISSLAMSISIRDAVAECEYNNGDRCDAALQDASDLWRRMGLEEAK